MFLKSFLPSPALGDYIHHIGIVHLVFPENATIPAKAYTPKPGNSIDFFLRDPEHVAYPGAGQKTKRASAIINGQHTQLINRYVGHEFLFLTIAFQPGALYRLSGIPLYELANTYIDAEAVFSTEIKVATEQLKNASSYVELIILTESFVGRLISRVKREAHRLDKAAQLLLQPTASTSMEWLAKESCLSPRQFERLFRERTGIPASQLVRIARFDKAFQLKNAQPEKDWLSIALQSGYYDYQHLVRDYKAFTGFTPTSFFQVDNQAPERLFGLHE